MNNKVTQHLVALGGQLNEDLATVFTAALSRDESPFGHAVHQLHGAVVLDLHALGEFSDRRPDAVRRALDGKQELVMLWFEARLASRLFAEAQILANSVPKIRERTIVIQSDVGFFHSLLRFAPDVPSSWRLALSWFDV